jgi:hypothetical protein
MFLYARLYNITPKERERRLAGNCFINFQRLTYLKRFMQIIVVFGTNFKFILDLDIIMYE